MNSTEIIDPQTGVPLSSRAGRISATPTVNKVSFKPTLFLFIPVIVAISLEIVFQIPLTGRYLHQIIFELVALLFLGISLIYFLVRAFIALVRKSPKLSLSYFLPIALFAVLMVSHNLIYPIFWPIRFALYHNHYAECIAKAVQIGDGNAVGFCEGTDRSKWDDEIVYDSTGQITRMQDKQTNQWRYAAMKAGVVGGSPYTAIPLSKGFYHIFYTYIEGLDMTATKFYVDHQCTGTGIQLSCQNLLEGQ